MSLKSLIVSLSGLVLFASLVPALASAQVYNGNYCNTAYNNTYPYQNTTTNCAPGNLLVYVQMTNQFINTYNYGTIAPVNFPVTVSGFNPSPASFNGSVSGTLVTVGGGYSVTAAPVQGYTATYSTGCNGALSNNQQATCVITETNSYGTYSPYPTPYPYNYAPAPLACVPPTQTVNLGQTVTFQAQGGDASQYNWQTPLRSYLNVGQTLNVVFTQTGTQTVTVTNDTQTATCTVNVVPSGAPAPIGYINPAQPGQPQAYVTPTYYPAFPNTGFAPLSSYYGAGAEVAFAAAALIALALLVAPYVRKAFAIVLG